MAISIDSGVLQNWANRDTREPSQTGTSSFLSALKSGNDRRREEELAAAAEAEDKRRWEAEFGLKQSKEDRLSTAARVKTAAEIAKAERNKRLDDARIENLNVRTEVARGKIGLAALKEKNKNARFAAEAASDKEEALASRGFEERRLALKEAKPTMTQEQYDMQFNALQEEIKASTDMSVERRAQIARTHALKLAEFNQGVLEWQTEEDRLDAKEAKEAEEFGLTEGNIQAIKLMDIIKGADKTGVTDITKMLLADALGVDPNRLSDVNLTPPTTYSGPLDVGISYTLNKGTPEEYEGTETILEQLGSTGDDKDAIAYRQGVTGKQGAATSRLIGDMTADRAAAAADDKRMRAMREAYAEEPTGTDIRFAKEYLSRNDKAFAAMSSKNQTIWASDFIRTRQALLADGKTLKYAQLHARKDMQSKQSDEVAGTLAAFLGMGDATVSEDSLAREETSFQVKQLQARVHGGTYAEAAAAVVDFCEGQGDECIERNLKAIGYDKPE